MSKHPSDIAVWIDPPTWWKLQQATEDAGIGLPALLTAAVQGIIGELQDAKKLPSQIAKMEADLNRVREARRALETELAELRGASEELRAERRKQEAIASEDTTLESLVSLHAEGFDDGQIGNRLGMSRSSVAYRRRKLGLAPNRR